MIKNKRFWLCFFVLTALLFGCAPTRLTRTEFLLDTVVTITLYGGDEEILSECFDICRDYEKLLSRTVEGSDVWRVNHERKNVSVNPKTAELIKKAMEYGEFSGGLFDISIGAVSSLWEFKEGAVPPDADKINAAVNTVDFRDIRVSDNTVTLMREGAMIDLGAIAKGFIADEIVGHLRQRGVKSAIVNLGGNVVALGGKSQRSPFVIGIKSPNHPDKTIGALNIRDKSVVTSGIYERNFMYNGKEYHHILNPETGMPHENGLAAVTVISDCSVDGDALSTALFLMGPEKGFSAAENIPGVEAIFIFKDERILTTSGCPPLK